VQYLDADTIRSRLDWPTMIAALERALPADIHASVRVNHRIDVPLMPSASLLLMAAWQVGDKIGVHLDLVGAFKSDTRETDDEAMRRADCIVDDHAAALAEGGDVVQALQSGAIGNDRIAEDLRDLVTGKIAGRMRADQITVLKSVGFALEDLASAKVVWDADPHEPPGSAH